MNENSDAQRTGKGLRERWGQELEYVPIRFEAKDVILSISIHIQVDINETL